MISKILKIILLLLSFYYFVLIVVSVFFPENASKFISDNSNYGDLFQMSKVLDFKIPLNHNLPINKTDDIESSKIIIMGDSFFNIAQGFESVADQLKSYFKVNVNNYNIQGSGEVWRKTNPLDYVKENITNKSINKILILESVDRGIAIRYKNINKNQETLLDRINIQTIKKNNILSDTSPPTGSIDTYKYDYQTRILNINGWAADNEDGSPIQKVSLLIDGQQVGEANLNHSRPDVAEYYKESNWINSGWSYSYPIELKSGIHTISINLTDKYGNNAKTVSDKYINISLFRQITTPLDIKLTKINIQINKILKNITFILEENPLNNSINILVSTIKFRVFHQISPLTPKYTLNPNALFYREEINFYQKPSSIKEISNIADNLSYISQELKNKYDISFVFIPMPTKYTIYNKMINETINNKFFEQLFSELDKKKVKYVDLYHPFLKSTSTLYAPSDTHWNKDGIQLALDQIIPAIKAELISN